MLGRRDTRRRGRWGDDVYYDMFGLIYGSNMGRSAFLHQYESCIEMTSRSRCGSQMT